MSEHESAPVFGTEDYRRKAVLFNDISFAPNPRGRWFDFSHRIALAEYLWEQGWRREVRPEDVIDGTEWRPVKVRLIEATESGYVGDGEVWREDS